MCDIATAPRLYRQESLNARNLVGDSLMRTQNKMRYSPLDRTREASIPVLKTGIFEDRQERGD